MEDHASSGWPARSAASNARARATNEQRRPAPLSMLQTRLVCANITPPDTPISPQATADGPALADALFHNYFRARHSFDPTNDSSADSGDVSVTVPIKEGDLILIHSIHENGWADGTVLTNCSRGWVPTNYCEPYDHPYVRNLLNAMTQFWDLLEDNEDASFSTFVRQDYVRGLIAGVRYLLEHAGCLHRDAPVVQQHVGIRRMRKGLLADLSSMVQKAKELQEEASQPYAGEVVHIVLDELVIKAYKVVCRAVRFIDTWSQEAMSPRRVRHTPLATPPADLTAHSNVSDDLRQVLAPRPPTTAQDDSTSSNPADSALPAAAGIVTKKRPVSTVLSYHGAVASHRLSLVKAEPRTGTAASEQLSQAHDQCIGHIGKFLGHHLHSRSTAELVETTDQLVSSCNSLLDVMKQVSPAETNASSPMQQARDAFQSVLDELIRSTKQIFKFSDDIEDAMVLLPDQISSLISIGTNLIRAVGECVIQTRSLLEQLGDFQLRQPPIQASLINGSLAEGANRTFDTDEHEQKPASSEQRRLSLKMLPPPPPVQPHAITTNLRTSNVALPSPATTVATETPDTPSLQDQHKFLTNKLGHESIKVIAPSPTESQNVHARAGLSSVSESDSGTRKDSVITSATDSTGLHASQFRFSETSNMSNASTRATSPDRHADHHDGSELDPRMLNSFCSISSIGSAVTDQSAEIDASLLQKTYAHELIINQQGQVSGGSLQALVEQLTTHDTTPDMQFTTTFYLTFRLFTSPRALCRAMIERFDYVGDNKTSATPVRLRICQFFKGWLETYWNADADRDALGDIRYIALHKLKPVLPSAAERLLELTRRVTAAYQSGTATGPLVSGIGKTSTSMNAATDVAVPDSVVTKAQLSSLRNAIANPTDLSILDIDPVEIARQLTLLTSKVYCEIQPDELLSLAWTKRNSTKASNVRRVSRLNTDLAYVVGDTILSLTEVKKRASIIKHWVKVASNCLEVRNFESLMAIIASLDCSMVQRLKRTWEVMNKKAKARFDELKAVIECSQNYASLRRAVDNAIAPCLPFLGIYLTDMTFVDAGNAATRQIPGSASAGSTEAISVINFDKYTRMAKIVTQIQRFQVPYRFHAVPELQAWLEAYLNRMREANAEIVGSFHRRSLILEPRQDDSLKQSKTMEVKKQAADTEAGDERPKTASGERAEPVAKDSSRMDLFWKHNGFGLKAVMGGRSELATHAEHD